MKLIKHAVHSIAVFPAYDKKTAEIELRLKGNFIKDLISENCHMSVSDVKYRLQKNTGIPNMI